MFFVEKEKWESWGISESSHKFFLSRWYELFDEDTFDSWQVRTSNVKSILHEILAASEVAIRFYPSHHNINWLIEEAKSIMPKDIVITESFGFIASYLDEIEKAYKDKVASEKSKAILEFQQVVRVTLDYMSPYRERVIKRLRIALGKTDNFEEIYTLSLNLGIELHNAGYSIEALRAGSSILTDPSDADFISRYDNLISKYSGQIHKYTCKFLISWKNSKSSKKPDLTDYGIIIHNKVPDTLSDVAERFFTQDKSPLIAEINVEATDHFSARYLSEELLESIFAVNKLYQPSGTSAIKHDLALVEHDGGDERCISPNNSRLGYVKDANNPDKKIADYSKVVKSLNAADREQLSSALQYYKLFTLASADEARLTNLWIACESLIQDGAKSIIERITTYLAATNCTSYIRLMSNSLPQSLRTVWRKSDTNNIRKKLKRSNEFILEPYDLIAILLEPEGSDLSKEFMSLIGDNPIVIYRINRLREKMFNKPGNLMNILKNHCRNLEWQIHRIYRARNHITHSGKCSPGTRHLIQNLQSYFVIAVHNLIHDLLTNPGWCINSAFEHRLLLHRYMLHRLAKHDNEPVNIEMLLNPTLCLSAEKVTPAWTTKKETGRSSSTSTSTSTTSGAYTSPITGGMSDIKTTP